MHNNAMFCEDASRSKRLFLRSWRETKIIYLARSSLREFILTLNSLPLFTEALGGDSSFITTNISCSRLSELLLGSSVGFSFRFTFESFSGEGSLSMPLSWSLLESAARIFAALSCLWQSRRASSSSSHGMSCILLIRFSNISRADSVTLLLLLEGLFSISLTLSEISPSSSSSSPSSHRNVGPFRGHILGVLMDNFLPSPLFTDLHFSFSPALSWSIVRDSSMPFSNIPPFSLSHTNSLLLFPLCVLFSHSEACFLTFCSSRNLVNERKRFTVHYYLQ